MSLTFFIPKYCRNDSVTAPVKHEWPDGYSGWLPTTCGSQVASLTVSGLLSVSARWIAWLGAIARTHPAPAALARKFGSS